MKTNIPFSEVADLGYYQFAAGVCKHRRGWYYWLDKISAEKKAEILEKYDNVCFLKSRCEYAPEIKSAVIFVANVKFDMEFEKIRKNMSATYVGKFFDGCKMYSVTSLNCKETETRYFHTKKEAARFIRENFCGLEKQIRLNDLACA